MKILIIDNEPDLRKVLRQLLVLSGTPDLQIEEAEGVQTGLQAIRNFAPDIVFLDIEMNDGTGFDLLQQIGQLDFQLIVTTAHDSYAIRAFKFSAIDFLLKPIDPDDLQTSLQKAMDNLHKNDLKLQLQVLMHQISSSTDGNKKIVLNDKRNTYFVKLSDILYCEAESTYTKFHFLTENTIVVSKNLKEYDEMLEPYGFIRTHHSYLVNAHKIKLLDKKDGGMLILEGGSQVPVSQRKKDVIKDWLEKN
jgi:two-component system LytT family response regulator